MGAVEVSIGMMSLSIRNVSYMSPYMLQYPDHEGTRARPRGLRMITDLSPTRIGVNPDMRWFQGSSRSAETYKATQLFAPDIDLKHIWYAAPTFIICRGCGIFFALRAI